MKKVRFVALLLVLVVISTFFVGCENKQSIRLIEKTKITIYSEEKMYYWFEFKTKQ